MIRNNISTFLNTPNSRWPPVYFVKRFLKICVNYLVVETKMYFFAEPMESRTYLDDHISLYCVYRHETHMVVNSTMVGDALGCF